MENAFVLIVDDEEYVRKAFSRALRGKPYNVLEAGEAKSALKILQSQPVDIIICDYRMPKVDGLTLLRMVKERFPDVIRIMLTGAGDMDTAIRATNDAEVYRFFTKPWDRDDLLYALSQAVNLRRLKKANRKLLNELEDHINQIKILSSE